MLDESPPVPESVPPPPVPESVELPPVPPLPDSELVSVPGLVLPLQDQESVAASRAHREQVPYDIVLSLAKWPGEWRVGSSDSHISARDRPARGLSGDYSLARAARSGQQAETDRVDR
jgi:hypothetical protein